MSYGTTIKDVFINRVNPDDVETKIEEAEDFLRVVRDELMMLVAATPRDTKDENGYTLTWEDYARRRTAEIIESIEECSVALYQLHLIKNSPAEDITYG